MNTHEQFYSVLDLHLRLSVCVRVYVWPVRTFVLWHASLCLFACCSWLLRSAVDISSVQHAALKDISPTYSVSSVTLNRTNSRHKGLQITTQAYTHSIADRRVIKTSMLQVIRRHVEVSAFHCIRRASSLSQPRTVHCIISNTPPMCILCRAGQGNKTPRYNGKPR